MRKIFNHSFNLKRMVRIAVVFIVIIWFILSLPKWTMDILGFIFKVLPLIIGKALKSTLGYIFTPTPAKYAVGRVAYGFMRYLV